MPRTEPTAYVLRVEGHLDASLTSWLGVPAGRHHPDGTTTITTPVADQDHLHEIIGGLRELGVILLDLYATDVVGADMEPAGPVAEAVPNV